MLQPLGRMKQPCANHILGVPMLYCLKHVSEIQSTLLAVRLSTGYHLNCNGDTDVSTTLRQVCDG